MSRLTRATLLAVTALAAAYLLTALTGGPYHVVATSGGGNGYGYTAENRFTGTIYFCAGVTCNRIETDAHRP